MNNSSRLFLIKKLPLSQIKRSCGRSAGYAGKAQKAAQSVRVALNLHQTHSHGFFGFKLAGK
jgi:hypothetical protein